MHIFTALNLKLSPGPLGHYILEMDFHQNLPGRQISVQQLSPAEVVVDLPLESLRASDLNGVLYGSQLSTALFKDTSAQTALKVARTHADAAGVSLHIGLDVSACSPEIQSLRWETLQDPEPGHVGWGFSERVLLSRRTTSSDMVPIKRLSRPAQSALIAIAAPSDLSQYGFSPIPVAAELERARTALHPLRLTTLARQHNPPCTLQHLLTALRNGTDILCLVAHGREVNGEVYLWLESELGESAPIPSHEIAGHLAALEPAVRPLLIVFAACESGGVNATGMPLSAIGPMMASEGIAAVLAMQGALSFETNAAFLPVVLSEVLRDGVIDRAVAAARIAVKTQLDWWAPILWLRLSHGQLWVPANQRVQSDVTTVRGDGVMNYGRGIATLKNYLAQASSDDAIAVTILEARFEENQRSERIFGSTEITRSERARIIYGLEEIALRCCGISLSDLSRGATPT